MTTTAATTSASSSTSNDSPIQDNNGASEPTTIEHTNQQQQPQQQQQHHHQQQQSSNNSNNKQANAEQKRPMNAFLLFCKRQRSLVREKYPGLENRDITKILGDWWSKLDKEQKSKYTDLARQHKEAFMKANPDFKWCKTPMSNNNNNSNNTNNSNSNSNDCYATNTRHTESLPPTPMDVVQSNSRETLTTRQQEAPKPPKKRFLERNDSIYTTKTTNNSIQTNNINSNESTSQHAKDGVVPYISLPQDTLDRVIDEAFSEKSNNSPSGINMCKCSNRISTNLTSSLGANPTSFSTSSTTTATSITTSTATTTASSSSSSSYSNSADEPVDFSMNRTINATRQQIINMAVEKMLSGPTESASNISKFNGTDSASSQPGFPVKRDNPEDT